MCPSQPLAALWFHDQDPSPLLLLFYDLSSSAGAPDSGGSSQLDDTWTSPEVWSLCEKLPLSSVQVLLQGAEGATCSELHPES